MNTHGHEDVANTAGIPLLRETLGKDKKSLRALYLGNWLTDVSQAVDPVAYWSASQKGKGGVDSGVETLKKGIEQFVKDFVASVFAFDPGSTVQQRVLTSLNDKIEQYAKTATAALHGMIDYFIAAHTNERDSRVAKFFRDCFLVKGYFKFVHPAASKQPPRMSFDGFMRVFGRPDDTRGAGANPADDRPGAYTQYYPHEHVDRPEVLPPQDPAVFQPGKELPNTPLRLGPGKQDGTRSPRNRKRLDPDLYSYLRDHMEMTAGLLAETDEAFEKALKKDIRDDDPNWYVTLAKLGHALHQVEDFFAHSNWVELAVKRLGSAYVTKLIPPTLGIDMVDRANTTFRKRLKRHLTTPLKDWRQHEDEDWVVTGFFDFSDTLISLAHVSEEIFGLHVPDPYAKGYALGRKVEEAVEDPATVEHQLEKVMRQTMDFLQNPVRELDNPDNKIAKSLVDRFGKDVNKLRRPEVADAVARQVAGETEFLNSAPKLVQDAFFRVIVDGSRVITIGKFAWSLYEVIHGIVDFLDDPIAWFADFLPKELKKLFFEALKFYGKERFYDWIGASRIGCHSLLAKDHGLEPFFDQSKACATAVHWYVVNTLLRWKANPKSDYIDWLDLLEYFLRNPLPPAGYGETATDAAVTIVHITQPDDQLKTLTQKYAPRAIGRFTWRSIADVNYNTTGLRDQEAADVINRILRDSGMGYPVTPPNYAYKKNVRVLIPQQRIKVPLCEEPAGESLWYKEVFDKGWEVFRGMDDDTTQTSTAPLQHHTPIVIGATDLQGIITRGKKLRREAREAYRPR